MRLSTAEKLAWDDPWLQSLDLEYHNVRREEGLYAELMRENHMQRFVTDDEIRRAIRQPPRDTRAYFRGRCIEKFAKQMSSVQWDEIAFGENDHESVVRLLNVFDDEDVRRYNAAIDKAPDVATLLRNLEMSGDKPIWPIPTHNFPSGFTGPLRPLRGKRRKPTKAGRAGPTSTRPTRRNC